MGDLIILNYIPKSSVNISWEREILQYNHLHEYERFLLNCLLSRLWLFYRDNKGKEEIILTRSEAVMSKPSFSNKRETPPQKKKNKKKRHGCIDIVNHNTYSACDVNGPISNFDIVVANMPCNYKSS